MSAELQLLLVTAASLGLLHTLIGPDHYLPFVAMAKARSWPLGRTLRVTFACGVGHVAGSLALGAAGIALGWALGGLEWIEGLRASLAAWLLLGFGLGYTAWGVRRALRDRPHSHWHGHADGTVHDHAHGHHGEHAHVHEAAGAARRLTPWLLFIVFVFGPCEALIPLLMAPAAGGDWAAVGLVALAFGVTTVGTMLAVVAAGFLGVARLPLGRLERYSHALAGMTLVACGLAMQLGL